MTIHYFSGEPWEEAHVRSKLPNTKIEFHAGSLSSLPELSDPETTILCTFIDSKIGEAELVRFPSLKLIATRSTGFDHIDLSACASHAVIVANVPSYGEQTVAEFAFGLILALSRKIIDADESVRERSMFSQDGLRGFDLSGKTLGIVGGGHIGAHVIKMGRGFDMKVLVFDVHYDEALARQLDFSYATLDELLAGSDIISLHVPHNPHTHHLINRDNIRKIKKGSYLINTARGAIIETEALVQGLTDGIIAGAGLDVLEEEGEMAEEDVLLANPHPNEAQMRALLANNYLIRHPRVIVTPHVAFNTQEAVERIVDTTIDNIANFIKGAPVNLVSAH